jgi:hypothetical protein
MNCERCSSSDSAINAVTQMGKLSSVCPRAIRHDLDRRPTLLRGLDQVPKLPAHHADAADDAMDHRLVDHGPYLLPAHGGGLTSALQLHGQAAAAQGRVLSWLTTSGHTADGAPGLQEERGPGPVPGGGAEFPLGLVPHPRATRQGRLVRTGTIALSKGVYQVRSVLNRGTGPGP